MRGRGVRAEVEDLVERVAQGEGEGTVVVDGLEVVNQGGCGGEESERAREDGGESADRGATAESRR